MRLRINSKIALFLVSLLFASHASISSLPISTLLAVRSGDCS